MPYCWQAYEGQLVHNDFLVIRPELAKNPPFPFDTLRANGAGGEFVQHISFVLSLSKQERGLRPSL
jgi:hypothetical protein